MHLITGAIIAALLKRKSGNGLEVSPLLKLKHPIRTSHIIPGRVRFHIPKLRNDSKAATELQDKLQKIEGITSVTTTYLTGSVLIQFDETKIRPELLAAAIIRLLGLEEELDKRPEPVIPREIREMGSSLNQAVYDASGGLIDLWSAIPLLLVGVAGKKILTDRTLTAPAAVTLLWWGYQSLFNEKGPKTI